MRDSNFPDPDVITNVKNFIIKHYGQYQYLNLNSLIERDLRMTGDDAFELMNEFGVDFSVDMSNFVFSKHFGEEAFDFISKLKKLVLLDFKREEPKRDVSVGQLVLAVYFKRWLTD